MTLGTLLPIEFLLEGSERSVCIEGGAGGGGPARGRAPGALPRIRVGPAARSPSGLLRLAPLPNPLALALRCEARTLLEELEQILAESGPYGAR